MDAREFKQRFMPHYRLLYRVAYHLTGNAQDAEDLLQDLYLKLWQKRDDLPDETINDAYLATMMRNLFVDQRRLKHVDASAELKNEDGPPDERSLDRQIDARDEVRQMEGLINELSERDAKIIQMHLVDDRSYEEIEHDTGLSQGNIRIIVMRTKKKLKQQFQNITKTWTNSIPEGLEERLLAKIDEWEQEETKQKAQRRRLLPSALCYMAVAASVALVLGVGLHLMRQDEVTNLAEQDTYQDPMLAQQEAERALNLLAYNLNKGMGQLAKAKALSDKTEKSLNKQLKVLKRYETDNY